MSLKILLIFLSLYDQFLWQLLVEGLGSVYKFIPTYTDLSWRMKVAESASAETGFVFAFFQVTGLKREFDAVFWQVVGLTDVDWLTDRPPPPLPQPFPPSLPFPYASVDQCEYMTAIFRKCLGCDGLAHSELYRGSICLRRDSGANQTREHALLRAKFPAAAQNLCGYRRA